MNDFLETLLVAWQPHDDNKTPGSHVYVSKSIYVPLHGTCQQGVPEWDCYLFFLVMKVISSTCPPSSKITGSSSEKNTEFSSFWTPYAFITGESPFPKVYTGSEVFPNSLFFFFFLQNTIRHLLCTLGRTATKRVTWARMTFVPSGRLSAALSSTTSARACHRRRCTASWDTSLPLETRTRWGGRVRYCDMHLKVY